MAELKVLLGATLKQKFKLACVAKERTMSDVVVALVENWLSDDSVLPQELQSAQGAAENETGRELKVLLGATLKQKFKLACVAKERTMSDVVVALIEDWLKEEKQ